MSVMFEACDEAALKERLELAVCRLKELHQEGLPDGIEKTGKPFACFLRSLIQRALDLSLAEKVSGIREEISVKDSAQAAALEQPGIAPYIRLLSAETECITDRGREADVIRLELILQVMGELAARAGDQEALTVPEAFHESLYWFYSDYSEPMLKQCFFEAISSDLSFPKGYGNRLPYVPGFLEWGDLTDRLTVDPETAEGEPDWLFFLDANLANRRLEAFLEAKKETEEAGNVVRTEFVISEGLCKKNRNYRHFIKRLKEISEHVENNPILAGGADH